MQTLCRPCSRCADAACRDAGLPRYTSCRANGAPVLYIFRAAPQQVCLPAVRMFRPNLELGYCAPCVFCLGSCTFVCVTVCVCVCVCVLSHSQESLVSYFYVFYDLERVLVAGRTLAP